MRRLIDANALMRDIARYHLSDGKFQHWVEVQPTIDAIPLDGSFLKMSKGDYLIYNRHWLYEHFDMEMEIQRSAMKSMGYEPALKDAQPHWIPCSERLPEEDGVYLVTYEKDYSEEYEIYPTVSIAPFTVGKGFGDWVDDIEPPLGSGNKWWVDIPVGAWMPLPKPYEVEEWHG